MLRKANKLSTQVRNDYWEWDDLKREFLKASEGRGNAPFCLVPGPGTPQLKFQRPIIVE